METVGFADIIKDSSGLDFCRPFDCFTFLFFWCYFLPCWSYFCCCKDLFPINKVSLYLKTVCLCVCQCSCQEDEPWRRAVWRAAAGWSERWWQTAERRGEPASSPESSHLAERKNNDALLFSYLVLSSVQNLWRDQK